MIQRREIPYTLTLQAMSNVRTNAVLTYSQNRLIMVRIVVPSVLQTSAATDTGPGFLPRLFNHHGVFHVGRLTVEPLKQLEFCSSYSIHCCVRENVILFWSTASTPERDEWV